MFRCCCTGVVGSPSRIWHRKQRLVSEGAAGRLRKRVTSVRTRTERVTEPGSAGGSALGTFVRALARDPGLLGGSGCERHRPLGAVRPGTDVPEDRRLRMGDARPARRLGAPHDRGARLSAALPRHRLRGVPPGGYRRGMALHASAPCPGRRRPRSPVDTSSWPCRCRARSRSWPATGHASACTPCAPAAVACSARSRWATLVPSPT
jgi:hypothetical protein